MTEKTSKEDIEKTAQKIMAERKVAAEKLAPKTSAAENTRKEPTSGQKTSSGKANWPLRGLLTLLVFLGGAATTLYFLPALTERLPFLAQWVGRAETPSSFNNALLERLTAVEEKTTQQAASLHALNQQFDGLSKGPATTDPALLNRLDKLEQGTIQADKGVADTSQSARIDMLLSRMSQLEASFVPLSKGLADAQEARLERSQLVEASGAAARQMTQVESRLKVVENYAARDVSGALLVFRLDELRNKVILGQAYDREIEALKALTEKGTLASNASLSTAISWLSQHRSGVTARPLLRRQFDGLIPDLIQAKTRHADDPWWRQAYNSIRNLVMLRRTDVLQGGTDSIIADAQQLLEQEKLKEAVTRLKNLPDNLRGILSVWIGQAEIYLQAEDDLNLIEHLSVAAYLDPEISLKANNNTSEGVEQSKKEQVQ